MKLDDLLLQKLANWRPDTTRQTLTFDHADSGWRVELQADAIDTVGGRFWDVTLRRTVPAANEPSLAELGERIANRVTGLLEPLRLVEVDGDRKVAQLRSEAPSRRGDALHYYEVLRFDDGTSTVRRYQVGPDSAKRQAVAFTLTHEALVKLVCDLAA